jgi:hypothetical protein
VSSSEHIFIEGDESDEGLEGASNGAALQHFHIVNRSHGLQTEMILFEGGWLSVREHRSSKPGVARMINLRYVDPAPQINRYFARHALVASAALAAAALCAAILAIFSIQPVFTVSAALVSLIAAAVAFATCAYKTRKTVLFVTRHGRAPVISLMATLGSFRAMRQVVPRLIEAIEAAADEKSLGNQGLRAEMREHYRLRECGVLTERVCAQSTQRILEHFV